jgi:MOSC domain-containing protein YiiM
VGEVLLEVTMACMPCGQMEDLRPGLGKEMRGRREMLCRFVKGGIIRRGDGIEKLA